MAPNVKDDKKTIQKQSNEIDAFLDKVATVSKTHDPSGQGRLIFAMDATASRAPSWDKAAHIQGEMFTQTASLGGLSVQLAFYRGFGEFKVSQWTNDTKELLRLMTSVTCLAGETQIAKVLSHARNQCKNKKINAVIFVGDSFEEDIDKLGKLAGELGVFSVPVFMFQEGDDVMAAFAYEQIAKLSGGVYCRFDEGAANTLKKLLSAVAVFAAGGRKALENHAQIKGGETLMIANKLKQ